MQSVNVIPSFFNKSDFWAMLMPGYITVTLGVLLFYPAFITGNNNNSGNNLPAEISVVVFIVAGPSVGFTLWQIYLHISSFVNFNRDQFNRKYEFGIRWNNGCTNLRIFGNHIKNATGNDSIDSTNPKSPSNVKI
jgi:hypothetical protein